MLLQFRERMGAVPRDVHGNRISQGVARLRFSEPAGGQRPGERARSRRLARPDCRHPAYASEFQEILEALIQARHDDAVANRDEHVIWSNKLFTTGTVQVHPGEIPDDFEGYRFLSLDSERVIRGIPGQHAGCPAVFERPVEGHIVARVDLLEYRAVLQDLDAFRGRRFLGQENGDFQSAGGADAGHARRGVARAGQRHLADAVLLGERGDEK